MQIISQHPTRILRFVQSVPGYTVVFILTSASISLLLEISGMQTLSLGTFATLYFSGLLATLYYQQKKILKLENEPHLKAEGIREYDGESTRTMALLLSNIGNGVATNIELEITVNLLSDEHGEETWVHQLVRSDLDSEDWFQDSSRGTYLNPDENRITFLADLDPYLKYGGRFRVPLIETEQDEVKEDRAHLEILLHYEGLSGEEKTVNILDSIGPVHPDIDLNEFLQRSFSREAYENHKQSLNDQYDPIDVADGKVLQDATEDEHSPDN